MGCSDAPMAVFIETNLGTRLAVPASPDVTAEDFEREVERTHLNCFPEFGEIRVKAVMVKQKSRCYHLSKSLPLKYAFPGSNLTWFLRTRVDPLYIPDRVGSLKCKDTRLHNLDSAANVITELGASVLKISALPCFIRKRRRKNVKREHKTGHPIRGPTQRSLIEKEMLCRFANGAEGNSSKRSDTDVIVEAISETISEPASVSGIIKKYFSDYDEVASNPGSPLTTAWYRHEKWLRTSTECKYSSMQSGIMSPVRGHISPQDVWLEKPGPEASREKHKTPDVGKCLLLASNGLGLTPSIRKSIISTSRFNDGGSPFHKMTAPLGNLVFEMADEGN
ncbi:hypothetical protein C2S52_005829 [Perilla frutescens var. hirtella]|nr:hypothetical protein C2S52_005829 [Perilla frutescens var. hirtella]